MSATEPQFLNIDTDGLARSLAYRQTGTAQQSACGLMWLNGFTSTMESTKVERLAGWSLDNGVRLTRFDYTAHGRSSGIFTDATIGTWLADAIAIFERIATGPQILIGSSMGGWLALLLLQHHLNIKPADEASRIKGVVLIAPAIDLTEAIIWRQLNGEARTKLEREGILYTPDQYGGAPIPITRLLLEEGRNHLLDGNSFDPQCPVRIIQGQLDDVVPWRHALKTFDLLDSNDVHFCLIKGGNHRLSRDKDITLLISTIIDLLEERCS